MKTERSGESGAQGWYGIARGGTGGFEQKEAKSAKWEKSRGRSSKYRCRFSPFRRLNRRASNLRFLARKKLESARRGAGIAAARTLAAIWLGIRAGFPAVWVIG